MPDPIAILFDSHMHTPLCKHARGHPDEYVETGMNRGLAGIIFTCHSPMPDGFASRIRMAPEQFDEYCNLVHRANHDAPKGFEVRLGMESDYFPGMEKWLQDLHSRADFHYILGSVHWHTTEYLDAFWYGDTLKFRKQYFEHLADSAESGLFDALAHPDLVKNMDPQDWEFEEVRESVVQSLDRIAATGIAMEINTSGLNKSYPEMNPGMEMLALMFERDIPIVLGSDSHVPHRVGANFEEAMAAMEKVGYDKVSLFRERERYEIPLSQAKETIEKPVRRVV